LIQLKKQKLEAAGSTGAVQALGMENDAPVVGPDALTANSRMVQIVAEYRLEPETTWMVGNSPSQISTLPSLPASMRFLCRQGDRAGQSVAHERPGGQSAFQIVRILAPRERTDRNVISVRISERELLRSSVRIEVWLLFEPTDERACPLQRQVEIIDTEEQ